MELPSKEVLTLLREKQVPYLFHANTVRTSCTFMRTGYLLARGTAHERSLDQTPQTSDKKDRSLGIWYDLFFDSSDIHARASKENIYGPVSFCFDLSILEQDWVPTVWVTKQNPIKWKISTPADKKWFTSIEELRANYNPYNFDQHVVLRNVGGSVRLMPYLRMVKLDNPKRIQAGTNSDLYSSARGSLFNAARAGAIESKRSGMVRSYPQSPTISERICTNCQCAANYRTTTEDEILRLFGS